MPFFIAMSDDTLLSQPGLNSLSKSFEPAPLEAHWGPLWEQRGYGRAGVRGTGQADAGQPSFAIQLPPPNVTGTLHMGHAFNQTIMDSLTRYHRMLGHNTLQPTPPRTHAALPNGSRAPRDLARVGQRGSVRRPGRPPHPQALRAQSVCQVS
jgi:valyl-tRNA synthetase